MMKTLISLNAYVYVYPYPYVVPLSERFLAELRCTDKGTLSVLNFEKYIFEICNFLLPEANFFQQKNEKQRSPIGPKNILVINVTHGGQL